MHACNNNGNDNMGGMSAQQRNIALADAGTSHQHTGNENAPRGELAEDTRGESAEDSNTEADG